MKKKSSILKIILFVVVGLLLLAVPFIAKNSYQVHIINMIGLYILLSLGLNIAMGFAGQFNLAIGALWGVGAYTAAILNTKLGFPFWINLPIAIIVAGVIGGIVGLPALKVRAHYLSIVTIGLGQVINLIFVNEESFTGGALGIPKITMPNFFGIALDSEEKYYYLILVFVVLGYLIARQIVSGRVGRNFRAIRDDYRTAPAMGVNAGFYKVLAFVISAAFAGAAGALFAHLNKYISPDIFEYKSTLYIMTMTMVGGMGNLSGSLIGGILLPVLQENLRAIKYWQFVVYGIAIMLVVLFMPGGIMQLVQRVRSSLKIRPPWVRKPPENLEHKEEVNVP